MRDGMVFNGDFDDDNENNDIQDNNSKENCIDIRNPQIGTAISDSNDLARNLFVNFTKSVLTQYPGTKTADLRRNCFENMNSLNSRDSAIINDLLVKAGAKKSNKGEHANIFEWEIKYPKAQWEQVFNKKNKPLIQ